MDWLESKAWENTQESLKPLSDESAIVAMSSKCVPTDEMVVTLLGHEIRCCLVVALAEALEAPANNLFHDEVEQGITFSLKPNDAS